jgi:hypothetical protein
MIQSLWDCRIGRCPTLEAQTCYSTENSEEPIVAGCVNRISRSEETIARSDDRQKCCSIL